jgi:hypothetical protein
MDTVSLLAVAWTAAVLLMLCLGDPKRRRNARLAGAGYGSMTRRLLVLASLLPGLGLALAGDGAAFMVWMGGSVMAGWLLTMVTAARQGA